MSDDGLPTLPTTLPAGLLNSAIRPFPGAAVAQYVGDALKTLDPNQPVAVFAYVDKAVDGAVEGKLGIAVKLGEDFSFAGDLEKRWTPGPEVDPLTWRVGLRWTPKL